MTILKTEHFKAVDDIEYFMKTDGLSRDEAVDLLKLLELRKINNNLEYLASCVERAPWNFEE
ncbi:protein of unknown function [Xenorhabdus poinarii G6]|uniref:Uncharacterized protein n=1 Tax=Xenorhabdus poinarii G6 TaxID=1354304 RepID=A0A068QZY2_9GAMM|nr:hypothetical protein [Xenorhabdus poinarii]CDG20602.1 protein of unknown function [Xenorhabdus poinarii G6]